ncbi:MAG: hypothetical protein WC511_02880 [Candidatus Pacearchaeota archaeon]
MTPVDYIHKLRLFIEQKYGGELKSFLLKDVEFSDEENKSLKMDVIRFQQNFPHKIPIKNLPYVDIFMSPQGDSFRLAFYGKTPVMREFRLDTPYEIVEAFFAALIWGATVDKKKIDLPLRMYRIH